jgi:hypothetical protein
MLLMLTTGAACAGATIEDMALLPPKLLAMNTTVAATDQGADESKHMDNIVVQYV